MSMLTVGCKVGDTVRRGKKWMYGWIHCLCRMYCKIYEVGVVFSRRLEEMLDVLVNTIEMDVLLYIYVGWMYYCIYTLDI